MDGFRTILNKDIYVDLEEFNISRKTVRLDADDRTRSEFISSSTQVLHLHLCVDQCLNLWTVDIILHRKAKTKEIKCVIDAVSL